MGDIRISGLSSNLDVQGIIDQLLKIEATKITTVQNKKLELETDVAAWGSISAALTNLTDSLYDLKSTDTWNQMSATPSSSTALGASATSNAHEAIYRITITDLARAHSVSSSKASDLGLASADDTLVGNVAGLSAGDTIQLGTGANAQTIDIEADDTLATLAAKINEASESVDDDDKVAATILDTGVNARLVITRKNTGSAEIAFSEPSEGGGETPLQALGIFSASATFNAANVMAEAQQNTFSVNGITMQRDSNNSITDAIQNVSLNLLSEDTTGSLTLTVARDTATPKAAIQEFITTYNTAVNTMKAYIEIDVTDRRNPKVGVLQGDLMVTEILYNLRRLISDVKSGYMDATNASYIYNGRTGIADSLQDIGVWTSDKNNQLSIIDETKLDHMLTNYFNKTAQVFRGVWNDEDGYTGGVAVDFHKYSYSLTTSLSGRVAQRINQIQDRINDREDVLTTMYKNIDRYEQRLWEQFGAMDEAIASMNSELSWLVGQLGIDKGGGKGGK